MNFHLQAQKRRIRAQALARRAAQPDKPELSRRILAQFLALPEYAGAHTVMFYVHVGSEVQTQVELAAALTDQKRIVVPYCLHGRLELFHLQRMDELQAGMYRILEPRTDLRSSVNRRVEIEDLDVIMVPGVAFDSHGARLGVGQGYYDKLLQRVAPKTVKVGLAFECQILEQLPTEAHDIFMDQVITESAIYRRSSAAGR